MTNRASTEREPLIHQHQAGTRVLRPMGIPPSGPHYIPAADVARRLQRACGSMIPRHRPNRRHEWRLWASKEIYRQFMIADLPRPCSSATERSYFTPRFSAYSSIRLYRTCISQLWILNRFYSTSKDGLECNRYISSILSKADGDILDLDIAASKNSSDGYL